MSKVLLLEDSEEFTRVFRALYKGESLIVCRSLGEFYLRKSQFKDVSLFVLDLQLPDGSGFEAYQELKFENKRAEIVMLTAKGESRDKLLGLSLEISDYIVKPIDPLELKARLDMHLRRVGSASMVSKTIKYTNIQVDPVVNLLIINMPEKEEKIELTSTELRIICELVSATGGIVSREELTRVAWLTDSSLKSRTVDTHVSNLRKKLVNARAEIISVYGRGYKLVEKAG